MNSRVLETSETNPTMRIHENAEWSQFSVLIAGMKQATVKKHNVANGAVEGLNEDFLKLRFLEAPESVRPIRKGIPFLKEQYTRHDKSRYPAVRKSQLWNKHGGVDP